MTNGANLSLLIPPTVALSAKERDAAIEIAFLSVMADREIDPDEESLLRAMGARLAAGAGADPVDALLARFAGPLPREEADAHLRKVAAGLTSAPARELAYRMAHALSIVDLASADEEFEFDLQLIDALGLDSSTVERLTDEVMTAFQPA